MHPHHVFAGGLVVNDLGPLDDPVWTKVPAALPREQFSYICPFHQILHVSTVRPWLLGKIVAYLAGVTVDGLESAPVELVFADPVVSRVDFDDSYGHGCYDIIHPE